MTCIHPVRAVLLLGPLLLSACDGRPADGTPEAAEAARAAADSPKGQGPRPAGTVTDAPAAPEDLDPDGDGVLGKFDACPTERQVTHRHRPRDGCPDGPAAAEFPDADYDGVPDSCDQCPGAREPFNGHQDGDGCPDVGVPPGFAPSLSSLPLLWFEASGTEPVSTSPLDAWAEALAESPELRVSVDSAASPGVPYEVQGARARVAYKALVQRGIAPGRLTTRGELDEEFSILDRGLESERPDFEGGAPIPPVVSIAVQPPDHQRDFEAHECTPPVGLGAADGEVVLTPEVIHRLRRATAVRPSGHAISPPAPLSVACARVVAAEEQDAEYEGEPPCRRISPVLAPEAEGLPRVFLASILFPWGPDRETHLVFASPEGVEFFFEIAEDPWLMGSSRRRTLDEFRWQQVFEDSPPELLVRWTIHERTGEFYQIIGDDEDQQQISVTWRLTVEESFAALCTFTGRRPECRTVQTRRATDYVEKPEGVVTRRQTRHEVSVEWLPDRRVRITAADGDPGPLEPLVGTHRWPRLPAPPPVDMVPCGIGTPREHRQAVGPCFGIVPTP